MRILRPRTSSGVASSRRNQPAIDTPVLPATKGFTPKGA